jgi:DNA-binding PadR family transcriptional regulator
MTDKPKSLDDLFGEEESILQRRHRERTEREKAFRETPEGQEQLRRDRERWEREAAKHELEIEQQSEDDDQDEDEEDDDQ